MKPRLRIGALCVAAAVVAGCASRSDWREFDRRAEAICSDGNDAIAALGRMALVATKSAFAYPFALAAIQARIAGRLAELQVPGENTRPFLQLIARLESLSSKSREYGAQLRAGEVWADGEMREAAVDAQNVALNLGLMECAHFGLP